MASHGKDSTLWFRILREQVLKNRIEYSVEYSSFSKMDHISFNEVRNIRYSAWKNSRRRKGDHYHVRTTLEFLGPVDFPWKDDTKCRFMIHPSHITERHVIFAFPLDWLSMHEPTTPVAIQEEEYYLYFDFTKGSCSWVAPFLVRDRFYNSKVYTPNPQKYESCYYPKKCHENWCITYFKFPPLLPRMVDFLSILLFKNVDFSALDAKVEAENLMCPVRDSKSLKIKDKPQFVMKGKCFLNSGKVACLCAACRRYYRSVEVTVCHRECITLSLSKISLSIR